MIIDHDIAGRLNLKDPTKTAAIRKKWVGQFRKRFRKLKGRINRFLLDSDKSLAINSVYQFDSDPEKVKEFLAWLQQQIDLIIFDNVNNPNLMWQNAYMLQAYEKGVQKASAELAKQGISIKTALPLPQTSIVGFATPSLSAGLSVTNSPIHASAIQLIYSRNFESLKGVTGEMSKQISRVLFEGIEQGKGSRDMARLINNRVDKIGFSRASLIARTETVRAYNVSKINETESLSEATGKDIKQEWVTAGDERVRSTHAHRNRKIYKSEVARSLLGEPNCRCSLVPFFEELDTKEDKEERARERKQGLKLVL